MALKNMATFKCNVKVPSRHRIVIYCYFIVVNIKKQFKKTVVLIILFLACKKNKKKTIEIEKYFHQKILATKAISLTNC